MRIIRGLKDKKIFEQGCALTIGNFDGVHLGHQAVIQGLAEVAQTKNLPVAILLFEPQPLEFFQPLDCPARLSSLREKVTRLALLPVDDLIVVRFNKEFAELTAKAFIREILINSLNTKYLVVGDDFRFGLKRQGDFALLEQEGKRFGFNVADTGTFYMAGQRVSSTLIRKALNEGNLSIAENMLGYPYAICGRVKHGKKLGRTLGFPTANIKIQRIKSPVNGVFAVLVSGLADQPWPGVANIGKRPTLAGRGELILEVHLFDFNQDIYGRLLSVELVEKIRSEQRFDSVQALQNQIKNDVAVATRILACLQ